LKKGAKVWPNTSLNFNYSRPTGKNEAVGRRDQELKGEGLGKRKARLSKKNIREDLLSILRAQKRTRTWLCMSER